MNEMEWLRQTRALARALEPDHDLWPGIRQRMQSPGASRGAASRLLPWAMAASLAVLSLLTGTMVWQRPLQADATTAAFVVRQAPDPAWAGAATELEVARAQLLRALAMDPESTYLKRMLKHTREQLRRVPVLAYHAR